MLIWYLEKVDSLLKHSFFPYKCSKRINITIHFFDSLPQNWAFPPKTLYFPTKFQENSFQSVSWLITIDINTESRTHRDKFKRLDP